MRCRTLLSTVNCIKHFLGLNLKMALKEESKHVILKMIYLSFNSNYLTKICVRLCNYIQGEHKVFP